jgi:hypothetical protein
MLQELRRLTLKEMKVLVWLIAVSVAFLAIKSGMEEQRMGLGQVLVLIKALSLPLILLLEIKEYQPPDLSPKRRINITTET